ncbi:hypothetical protein AAVH_32558 [Aphelenchoides avenae]|nr:hypothetical protein AAVH_32558 [Aphelenchus avenae]
MKPLLASTEANVFDKLPNEILLQTLSFLDRDGLDVLNLSCRRFSDVIEHDSGLKGRLALRAIEKVNVAKEA